MEWRRRNIDRAENPRFGLEPFADDASALLAIARPRYSVVRLHYRNVLGRYQP
jgi:hypothetical protein